MKTIKQDELYRSLADFMKSKGVELKEGVYSRRISRACDLLTTAINQTRKTVKSARSKVGRKLDKLRQTLHEATAPRTPPARSSAKRPPSGNAGTRRRRRHRSSPAKAAPKS